MAAAGVVRGGVAEAVVVVGWRVGSGRRVWVGHGAALTGVAAAVFWLCWAISIALPKT